MKNFVQPGKVLNVTLSGTVAAGDVVEAADLIGVAESGGVSGDVIAVALEGVCEVAKVAGTAFNQGDVLYWDADPGNLTKTATGNKPIGYAFEAALSAATVAKVLLAPGIARVGAIA